MQLSALIIGAVTQDSLYWEPIVKALRCIQIFKFWGLIDPYSHNQNKHYHTHYYPKYEIWSIEKKLVNNPFKPFRTLEHLGGREA